MRFQKGQSVVEFAIILPFLVLFMIGLMYFGLMFSNYVALNDIARDAARSAAMLSDTTYKEGGDDPYASIRQAYVDKYNNSGTTTTIERYFLPNSTYLWNPSDQNQFKIEYESATSTNGEVIVTLTANLDQSNGSLAGTFFNVVGNGTLETLVVTYHMYSEVNHST